MNLILKELEQGAEFANNLDLVIAVGYHITDFRVVTPFVHRNLIACVNARA